MIWISKITEALYLPFLIIVALSILLSMKSWYVRVLIVLMLFLILWRVLNPIQSKRYYSVFVLFSFVSFGYFLWLFRKYSKYLLVIIVPLILLMVFKIFSRSSNLIEFSIMECFSKIDNSNNDYTCVSLGSISKRYSLYHTFDEYPVNRDDYKSVYIKAVRKHIFTQKDIFLISKYPLDYYSLSSNHVLFLNSRYTHLANFKFGYKNKNHYSLVKISPSDFDNTTLLSGSNQIGNGNFEKVFSQPAVQSFFRDWIDDGASFYLKDDLSLPYHDTLATTWQTSPDHEYPEIFIDSEHVISGDHSLHVRSDTKSSLYFLNKIDSSSGVLSFSIKSLLDDFDFSLIHYDYGEEGIICNDDFVLFHVSDNNTHTFFLEYDRSEFNADTTLFLFQFENADFIIDDISFQKY